MNLTFDTDLAALIQSPGFTAPILQLIANRLAKQLDHQRGIAVRAADRFFDDPVDHPQPQQILRGNLHGLGGFRGLFIGPPQD